MKNQIFYFTGTGNCLLMARELANALGDTFVHSIARDEINYPIETLGIITPIYFGALPPIVHEFVERLEGSQINYIYSIVTNNGYAGATHHIINKILKKKGKFLINGGITGGYPCDLSHYFKIGQHLVQKSGTKNRPNLVQIKRPGCLLSRPCTKLDSVLT